MARVGRWYSETNIENVDRTPEAPFTSFRLFTMSTRVQQDSFTDDADESCPLCVEEFDLSDKNFRPCPCGYQVCQFCYNNIKNNMNGLCPACRRPYDDQSIEWKIVSPEEQKADIALQARKKALARKKETEQRQVETNNRKHLAGLRVVQKKLVYVVGLSQQSSEEEFLKTLRGDQYFGQYGKIIKIVVSKAKAGSNNDNSIGVYVTFEKKEDAAKCIAAVDGSRNLDRPLRAQYGTTKYCSAYLRNETCVNRNCTFLHEVGEDYDSFSRQDLSSMNAMSTQRPAQQPSSSRTNRASPQPQPPPQQAQQSISAALHSGPHMVSRDEAMSRSDSGDGSALPSSASWATKNAHQEAPRPSKPASVSTPSPVVASSNPTAQPAESAPPSTQDEQSAPRSNTNSHSQIRPPRPPSPYLLDQVIKKVADSNFEFTFDRSLYSDEDLKIIDHYPPLFSDNGGLVRYRILKEQEQERMKQEEERNVIGAMSTAEDDEKLGSGSLQLGGEPDTQEEPIDNARRLGGQPRSTIQPPFASPTSTYPFGGSAFQSTNVAGHSRTLTPQQQQQLSLLQRAGSTRQSPVSQAPFQQGYTQTASLHQHQTSNPFQTQMQNSGAFGTVQSHARQASRYTFSNDSTLAPAAIKPSANPQLSQQQAGVLPAAHGKPYQGQQFQQSGAPNFYSGVQGPPPGLKSSGTPPISGGGMFGQGHGFASAMGGSAGFGANMGNKGSHEEMIQQLLRSRERGNSGQGPDLGKRELKFPFAQQHMTSDAPASNFLSSLYGSQLGAHQSFQENNVQKQKKKGKKHRHANTSSSGGGGIVDLADPSILQARMHHGGAGQGQFSAQEAPQAHRLAGAASKADNLVADAARTRTSSSKAFSRAVPAPASANPRLSLAQDFPSLPAPTKLPPTTPAPPQLQRKVTASKAAAGSVLPAIPKKLPVSAPKPNSQADLQAVPKVFERLDVVVDNSNEGPVRASKKEDDNIQRTVTEVQDSSSAVNPESAAADKHSSPPRASEKRQRPEQIDIGAAKDASTNAFRSAAESSKTPKTKEIDRPSTATQSQPATPAAVASQTTASPATRPNQPKTIRIGSTPVRNETASYPVPASPGDVPPSASSKQVSRRPSVTSTQQPGTPLSERISDNASLASTSLSRANSPPPSRVGTAPIRTVSKAQQKKERQTRAKQTEEAKVKEVPAKPEEFAIVQEPIVGRKKKTKKAKQGTADSTPAPTRPSSPERKTSLDEEAKTELVSAIPPKESKRGQPKSAPEPKKPEEPAQPATLSTEDSQKQLTPAATFASLIASGQLDLSASDLFKSFTGINTRFDSTADLLATSDPLLSDTEARRIDAGAPVLHEDNNGRSTIVLPDRRPLRGFSRAQAQRFLDLVERNGLPPLNPDLENLLPRSKVAAVTAATAPSAPKLTDSKLLVNCFATDIQTTSGPTPGQSLQRALPAAQSVEEAESRLIGHKRETEAIEKRLNALLKRNRRLVLGGGH
ncbi:MAG: hypothetical protein Q9217_004243 [Psora testacea]